MKIERTLIQKGSVIVVKNKIEDSELSTKDVLNNIAQIKSQMDQIDGQLKQMQESRLKLNDQKAMMQEDLKKLLKFEEWAEKYQESTIKNKIEENMAKCLEQVDKDYKIDPAMTEEQNKLQKFVKLQHALATCADVANSVGREVITKCIFVEPVFENPF